SERQSVDTALVRFFDLDNQMPFQVPEADRAVGGAARDHDLAIRAGRGHRVNLHSVAMDESCKRVSLEVPQAERSIPPATHDPASIGDESQRPDRAVVSSKIFTDLTSRLAVPEPHHLIGPRARQASAIGTKGHCVHLALVRGKTSARMAG